MTIELADDEWRSPVETPIGNGSAAGQLIQFGEEEIEETSTDRVAMMLGAVSADDRAKVVVSRIIGANKYGWCEDYSVADYERGGTKMIRDQFGPGEYDIRLYGIKPGTNRFLVLARSVMTIVKGVNEALPMNQNSEIGKVLQAMQEQQTAMLKALTEKPLVDPRADLMQTITMVSAMKEAFGMGGQQKDSIFEIIKSIKAMKEVSEELNPPKKEEENDPMMAMLGQFLPVIQTAMQSRQQSEPQQMMQLPSPVGVAPTPVAPLTPQPAQETPDMNILVIIKLKTLLTDIIMQAQAKAPIEPAAELLYAELPDELMDVLPLSSWFEQLKEYTAMIGVDIELHKQWLTEVRDRVVVFLREDEA